MCLYQDWLPSDDSRAARLARATSITSQQVVLVLLLCYSFLSTWNYTGLLWLTFIFAHLCSVAVRALLRTTLQLSLTINNPLTLSYMLAILFAVIPTLIALGNRGACFNQCPTRLTRLHLCLSSKSSVILICLSVCVSLTLPGPNSPNMLQWNFLL